jgi:hypothetical protein
MKPLIVVLVAAFALSSCARRDYWHQRLTLLIETPERMIAGSAVTSVRVVDHTSQLIVPDARGPRATVIGEAVAVEVRPGKWLFALLDGADGEYSSAKAWVYDAYGARLKARGSERLHDMVMDAVNAEPYDIPVPLPPDSWPLLVTFTDITDPLTVQRVDPENLAASFGPGVRLKAVTLEITEEPVTVGKVVEVLGWLRSIWPNQLDGRNIITIHADNRLANYLAAGNFSTEISK